MVFLTDRLEDGKAPSSLERDWHKFRDAKKPYVENMAAILQTLSGLVPARSVGEELETAVAPAANLVDTRAGVTINLALSDLAGEECKLAN